MRDILSTPPARRRYGVDRSNGATIVYSDGTAPRVWGRALNPMRSPCRVDRNKGLQQHRCSAAHASLVEGYRAYREAALDAAEAATLGYETELAEYWETHERPTLKAYLTGTGRSRLDEES